VIPVALGLLGPNGADQLPEGTQVVELDAEETTVTFEGLGARPVPSLLRGFSAPVRLERETTDAERAFLLAHDSDPFNRWEAGRAYAMDVLLRMIDGAAPDRAFLDALTAMARDEGLDPAFRAVALELPGEEEIAQEIAARGGVVDQEAAHAAREALRAAVAGHDRALFAALYEGMAVPGTYNPDADAAGKRALRNRALGYLTAGGDADGLARAARQFETADNMTEQAPALTLLVHADAPQAAGALAAFYDRWKENALVVDKWFMIQATAPVADALDRVKALTGHPAFNWLNPNRFRSVIGGFAMGSPSRFHAADGAGYAFFTDWLLKLDGRNPQIAARLAGAFETWRRYDEGRRTLMRAQLDRIAATEGLSKDLRDIVTRLTAG
jgi:aminopeptidase N